MIELLIVLAIISLIVGLGIPLFNVLTGSRSVEAGRNVVAANIGQARTIAVNQGRYAGVLFYVDPATERTAVQVFTINDPSSGLDDADPYDKYKTWLAGETYQAGQIDPTTRVPTRGDRVISFTSDADATFKAALYSVPPAQRVSNYLEYFGNYRPTVRTFRCVEEHDSQYVKNYRPPTNGPYNNAGDGYSGSAPTPARYYWAGTAMASAGAGTAESTEGPFANQRWATSGGVVASEGISPYAPVTLLPNGVGLQVIIQGTDRYSSGVTVASNLRYNERYLRTGIILFDSQGRLVLRDVSIRGVEPIGQTLGIQGTAWNIHAGVGIALYDRPSFRSYVLPSGGRTSEVDWMYHSPVKRMATAPGWNIPRQANEIESTFTAVFDDYQDGTTPAQCVEAETEEEAWLDNNATPVLINRYSGALSDTN